MAHTLTAQFPVVDGGKGYHLGEVQSDFFQNQREVTKLGREPEEKLRSRSEELALREKFDSVDYEEMSSSEVWEQKRYLNFQRSGETDSFIQLPYGESTNQWVDMVLRKELAKAIDSGSEFMTIPSSDLVRKYTSGSEEGQGKFYDQIVPMRLNKLAKKYDPNISIVPQKIKTEAGEENVTALPLTQKLIDNIMNKGLPKYAVPITGGSLGALSFVEGEQQ